MDTVSLKNYLSDVLGREQALFTANQILEDIKLRIENPVVDNALSMPEQPRRPARVYAPDDGILGMIFPSKQRLLYDEYLEKIKQFNADMVHYDTQMERYLELQKAQQVILTAELQKKQKDIDTFIKGTQSTLESLYAFDIIYGKYRYFVAIASICEYFQAGRCSSLGDAYNLFEEELRSNIIIGQLNTVIRELQQIRNSQYLLFEAINESNRIQQNIANELNSINSNIISANKDVVNKLDELKGSIGKSAKSSAMTAYFAREAANNSRLLVEINRGNYGLLFDKKGNVIYSGSRE